MTRLILEQVAAGSPEAVEKILPFVENLNFAALGASGAVLFLFTTVLALGNVEKSLNQIWGLKQQRSWERRIPDYLAVLIVSPILLGVALSLSGTLQSQSLVQRLLEIPLFATLYDVGLRQAAAGVLGGRLLLPLLVSAQHPGPSRLRAPGRDRGRDCSSAWPSTSTCNSTSA